MIIQSGGVSFSSQEEPDRQRAIFQRQKKIPMVPMELEPFLLN